MRWTALHCLPLRRWKKRSSFAAALAMITPRTVGSMALARTQMVHGQLRAAEAIYSGTLAQAQQRGMGKLPITAQAHVNLGRIYYEWNKLEAAAEQLWLGVERMHGQGGSWLQFEVFLLLARLEQARLAVQTRPWRCCSGLSRPRARSRLAGLERQRLQRWCVLALRWAIPKAQVPGSRTSDRRQEIISTACARQST